LENTIVDDDDDEDFNKEDEDEEEEEEEEEDGDEEEEEEEISNEDATKATKEEASNSKRDKVKKETKLSPEEQEEINERTIFINNIPKDTKPAAIRKMFAQFGHINNLHFRSIVPENISKKVAAVKHLIHPRVAQSRCLH